VLCQPVNVVFRSNSRLFFFFFVLILFSLLGFLRILISKFCFSEESFFPKQSISLSCLSCGVFSSLLFLSIVFFPDWDRRDASSHSSSLSHEFLPQLIIVLVGSLCFLLGFFPARRSAIAWSFFFPFLFFFKFGVSFVGLPTLAST